MSEPSIDASWQLELWPQAPGEPGPLPPGALSFVVEGDLQSPAVVRQAVLDGEREYSDWPGDGGSEACCTHLCSLGDPVAGGREVWGMRMLLDQGDDLLCHLGADGTWIVAPRPDLDGQRSRAMVEAMRELLLSEPLPVLGDGEVVALPGPRPADLWGLDELPTRSWHARVGSQVVRALESSPERGFEDARLKARRLALDVTGGDDLPQPGQLFWIDQEVRLFAAHDIPGLDDPLPAARFGPAVELLVDELRRTPWTRDVPLELE